MTERYFTNERLEQELAEELSTFNTGTFFFPLDNLGRTSLPPPIGATTLGVTDATAIMKNLGPDKPPPQMRKGIPPAWLAAGGLAFLALAPLGV